MSGKRLFLSALAAIVFVAAGWQFLGGDPQLRPATSLAIWVHASVARIFEPTGRPDNGLRARTAVREQYQLDVTNLLRSCDTPPREYARSIMRNSWAST